MKIGVVVPTQGKRPNFLARCYHYLDSQTLKPDIIEVVDNDSGMARDLTWRYRVGIDRVKDKCDLIFAIEDDDFYASNYIETMVYKWEQNGRPDIFGPNTTIYYHLAVKKLWQDYHEYRSSMFSTCFRSEAIKRVRFPADSEISLDMNLWKQMSGKTFHSDEIICVGIKHGIGSYGGVGHDHNRSFYKTEDPNFNWLRKVVGDDNLEFYKWMAETRTA